MKLPVLFSLLLSLLLVAPAGAVTVTEGPTVTVNGTTALVKWTTDTESGSKVLYGLEEGKTDQKAEGTVGEKHEVTLTGLQSGATYYYSVGTARKPLKTGTFSTGGKSAAKPAPKPQPEAKPAGEAAAKPAPPARPAMPTIAPPTRATWGNMPALQDHYLRHGPDFKSKSADDYAAQAWFFLQRATIDGLPAKQDEDGTIRVFDPKTGAFAAYNRNFTTKTYFKPGGRDYFDRQPGRPVKLKPAAPR